MFAGAEPWQCSRQDELAALQQAVTAGFRDAARVKAEKAFDKLRADPEFVAVVEGMR